MNAIAIGITETGTTAFITSYHTNESCLFQSYQGDNENDQWRKFSNYHCLNDLAAWYLETALFTGEDENMFYDFDVNDFANEYWETAKSDIVRFCQIAGFTNVAKAIQELGPDKFANNIWYNRCGHGVGFWESYEAWGPILDKAATSLGEKYCYIGDDDKPHIQ